MILESNLKLAPLLSRVNPGKEREPSDASAQALAIASAVAKDVDEDRKLKRVNPKVHWDYYHGYQAQYFVQRRYEDDGEFRSRKDRAKITNYTRFIVDLDTKFLYGRPGKIGRHYGENEKTENRIRKINSLIGIHNMQMEAKRSASLYGEQGFRLIPVDSRTGMQVDSLTKIDENVYPHPVALDPKTTFFLVNPYGKISAVVIETEVKDYVNEEKTVKITELVTDDSRWIWHDDALQVAEANKYNLRDEFILEVNNKERIDSVQDMLSLNTALNETITDNAYFFSRHATPQLVSSVDLSKVIGKDNMVWEINLDSDESKKVLDQLGFLVWDGKMDDARAYLEDLEAKIFKVTNTAAISTGDLKGIGNLRSGAAIITTYAPTIQKALEQQIVWAENERKFCEAILSFDSLIHSTTVEQRFPDFEFEMRFPKDNGVPGEELMNAEIRQINLNSHLKPMKTLIRDENPDYNNKKIEETRQEILDDSEALVDSSRKFLTEQAGENSQASSSQKKSGEQTKSTK